MPAVIRFRILRLLVCYLQSLFLYGASACFRAMAFPITEVPDSYVSGDEISSTPNSQSRRSVYFRHFPQNLSGMVGPINN